MLDNWRELRVPRVEVKSSKLLTSFAQSSTSRSLFSLAARRAKTRSRVNSSGSFLKNVASYCEVPFERSRAVSIASAFKWLFTAVRKWRAKF